jgi:hypothetical protein
MLVLNSFAILIFQFRYAVFHKALQQYLIPIMTYVFSLSSLINKIWTDQLSKLYLSQARLSVLICGLVFITCFDGVLCACQKYTIKNNVKCCCNPEQIPDPSVPAVTHLCME